MKFKVGDKVKVRKDLKNGYYCIVNLEDYQNDKVFTIKREFEDFEKANVYTLLEDKIKYHFREEMLIPAEEEQNADLEEKIELKEDDTMKNEKVGIDVEVNVDDEKLQDTLEAVREVNDSKPNITIRGNKNVYVTINNFNVPYKEYYDYE